MSKEKGTSPEAQVQVPEAVDVVDGIPDRAAQKARWKWVLIGAVCLGWMALLIYCQLAGNLSS